MIDNAQVEATHTVYHCDMPGCSSTFHTVSSEDAFKAGYEAPFPVEWDSFSEPTLGRRIHLCERHKLDADQTWVVRLAVGLMAERAPVYED
jgi:hypothetical protein